MIKIIPPGSWDFDAPQVRLVKMSSSGLRGTNRGGDLFEFRKQAAESLAHRMPQAREKLRPGELLGHLYALGCSEKFASNRNGDYFDADDCRGYHHTFVDLARFFRNHANKQAHISYGRVLDSAFNEPMGRIELLFTINGTKQAAEANGGLVADRELEALAKKQDIPVSMSCSLDPATPVLTTRGYRRIADIVVGDIVHTHAGNWKTVTAINRRRYTGEVLKIRVQGLPVPLELTADHPMYAKVLAGYPVMANSQRAPGQWAAEVAAGGTPFGWTHVGHLQEGDRVACRPVYKRIPGVMGICDVPLAELLGTYVAEGSLQYNADSPSTTIMTINSQDWSREGIPLLLAKLWPGITVNLRPKANSTVSFSQEIFSTELATWLGSLAGTGAKTKIVPREIYNATVACKLAFMGRWLDGDGFVDKKGVHWSSANLGLLLQGRDILLSVGIPAAIYRITHKERSPIKSDGRRNKPYGKRVKETIEYTLNISKFDASPLRPYSKKITESPHEVCRGRQKQPSLYQIGEQYAYRIKKIERYVVTDAPTYNFEVEGDNSYSLMGMSSHNCKIAFDVCSYCGNKAVSPKHYCVGTDQGGHCKAGGLRDRIGALVEIDGGLHRLGARNPRPHFFDISHIVGGRGADPIAFVTGVLEKQAIEQGATSLPVVKSADIAQAMNLVIPEALHLRGALSPNTAKLVKLAYRLAEMEDAYNRGVAGLDNPYLSLAVSPAVQQVVKFSPPADYQEKSAAWFRSLADERICLPVAEFVALCAAGGREKAAEIASVVARELPGIYTRLLADENLVARLAAIPYTPVVGAVADRYHGWSSKVAEAFSLRPQFVSRRIARASLQLLEPHMRQPLPPSARDTGAAGNLAEEYALYKLAFLAALPDDAESQLTTALAVLQNYT